MILESRWAWLSASRARGDDALLKTANQTMANLASFWSNDVDAVTVESSLQNGSGVLFVPAIDATRTQRIQLSDERGEVFVITPGLVETQVSMADQLLDAAAKSEYTFRKVCAATQMSFTAVVSVRGLQETTYIVRDRLGSLPVFWRKLDGEESIAAGHDPRAIQALVGRMRTNLDFFAQYIYYRYDHTVGIRETPFQGLRQLEPASLLRIRDHETKEIRYWSFEELPTFDGVEAADVLYRTKELLEESVRSAVDPAVVGEDPVLALSGGLDSGVIAAYARKWDVPLRAITAMYDVKHQVNEYSNAQMVALHLDLLWQPVSISSHDFLDCWMRAYRLHSLPLATSSVLGYELLYEQVLGSGATGLILGSRSDSFFAGDYLHYRYHLADLLNTDSRVFEQELDAWITNHSTNKFPKSAKEFIDWSSQNLDLQADEARIIPHAIPLELKFASWQTLRDLLRTPPNFTYTSSSYLRAHMAHHVWRFGHHSTLPRLIWQWKRGLAITDGFASTRLFEWVWALPGNYKITNGMNKTLLREIAKELLPSWQLAQRDKTGFNVPFDEWMLRSEFRDFMSDLLMSDSASWIGQLVDVRRLLETLRQPADMQLVSPMFVWQLINSALYVHSLNE